MPILRSTHDLANRSSEPISSSFPKRPLVIELTITRGLNHYYIPRYIIVKDQQKSLWTFPEAFGISMYSYLPLDPQMRSLNESTEGFLWQSFGAIFCLLYFVF